MSDNALRFGILGPLEVVAGGVALDAGGPKQRAVLASLVIEAGKVVPLDRLIDQLWGDEPPARAIGTLQAYVSNLRRIIEPDRPARSRPEILVSIPPGYALKVDPAGIDAVRFERGVGEGRGLLETGDAARALVVLEEALAMWRGPALADFATEEFARVEAARLEELRLVAVEERLASALALGRHDATVPELEALTSQHPMRERFWEHLLVALYRAGRQADALHAYQRARGVLADELGIDPGPALQRLEADILKQSPDLEWHAPVARAPGAAPSISSAIDLAPPSRPLVGRSEQLEQLRGALGGVLAGRGAIALIRGEPGIGKTRLAEELAANAASEGALVAWGRSHEGEGAPILWPWVQIVRQLTATTPVEALRRELGAAVDDLAVLLPELAAPVTPAIVGDPERARDRAFAAASQLILTVARERPLVLLLDDLQWADVATLQLLRFFALQTRNASVLVVGTYRDAEEHGPVLREALGALAREPHLTHLGLTGLEREHVGEFLRTALSAPTDDLVEAAYQRTSGNPFFLSEIVRLLATEKRGEGWTAAAIVDARVPSGVQDVIRRRLARLPEQTLALLSIAAVAGRDVRPDVVASVAGLSPDDALDALEPALLTMMLVEHPERFGTFRFAHDLLRETLIEDLGPLRRARMHARIGEALEATTGDDGHSPAMEIATHFWKAAPVLGAARAFEPVLAAAEHAERHLAYEQAIEQLERAATLAAAMAAGPDRDRRELDVHVRLAVLRAAVCGYAAPEVESALERVRDLWRPGLRGALSGLWTAWGFHCVRAEFDEAMEWADLMFSAGPDHPLFMLGGHQAAGVVAWHRGDLATAADHLRRGRDITDAIEEDRGLTRLYHQHPAVATRCFLALVLLASGRKEEALAEHAAADEFQRRLGHPFTSAFFAFFDAMFAHMRGDREHTRQAGARAEELSARYGFRLFEATGAILRAWADAPHEPDATARLRAALDAFESTGARMLRHCFIGLLADAEATAGHTAEARAELARALAASAETGETFYRARLEDMRGGAAVAR